MAMPQYRPPNQFAFAGQALPTTPAAGVRRKVQAQNIPDPVSSVQAGNVGSHRNITQGSLSTTPTNTAVRPHTQNAQNTGAGTGIKQLPPKPGAFVPGAPPPLTPVQPPKTESMTTQQPWQTSPYDLQTDKMWQGIQDDQAKGLEGMLQGTYADEARQGRTFNEMNANMGGNAAGGAFAGGQAQVALGGMQQRLGARNQWGKQQLDMKMAYLGNMMKQAEASKDRELQAYLQGEADKTSLLLAEMQYGGEPNAEEGAGGGGGGSPGMIERNVDTLTENKNPNAKSGNPLVDMGTSVFTGQGTGDGSVSWANLDPTGMYNTYQTGKNAVNRVKGWFS